MTDVNSIKQRLREQEARRLQKSEQKEQKQELVIRQAVVPIRKTVPKLKHVADAVDSDTEDKAMRAFLFMIYEAINSKKFPVDNQHIRNGYTWFLHNYRSMKEESDEEQIVDGVDEEDGESAHSNESGNDNESGDDEMFIEEETTEEN